MSFKNKLDLFEYSPALAILPKDGQLTDLENYSSGLFARLEKVKETGESAEEQRMLETILEWLAK